MVFVELTPFVRFREEHWTDDELRALQRFLLVTPPRAMLSVEPVGSVSCAGPRRGVASAAEPG